MEDAKPSIAVRNLNKYYGSFHALKDIDLAIAPGHFVVMLGPSGCGKSTLLRSIAGLEEISSGTIKVNDRDVTELEPRDRNVAMVFQNYALYPHMNVAQNMSFGLRLAKRPKAEIDEAVKRAAEILHMTPLLDKRPRQLSGGQRQRVAIGRAITRSPEVFLFDEPLSNLDAALRAQMRVELARLHKELGATMIYVTHDQVEAMTMADRIVLLRDGVIEQIGEPLELYNRPVNRFVASFLGSPKMNYFPARIDEVGDGSVTMSSGRLGAVTVDVPDGGATIPAVGETVFWGIRPESIAPLSALTDGDVAFDATVVLEERLGRETVLYLETADLQPHDGDGYVISQRNIQSAFATGDTEKFGFCSRDLHLFDQDGEAFRWARETGIRQSTGEQARAGTA